MRTTLLPAYLAAGLFIIPLAAMPTPASAQSVALVNGEPVTAFDVEQRIRIARVFERRELSRPQALESLIEDRVKLDEGRRIGMRINEAYVEDAFSRFASANKMSPAAFEDNMRRSGIQPSAVKARIRADAVWTEVLRQRSRNNPVPTAEIDAMMEEKTRKGETTVIDYVLTPIVFVVTAGTGGAGQRMREAQAAQARFSGCEEGAQMMRGLKDVAVRDQVSRSSTGLSDGLKQLLASTPVGKVTRPFATEQGIELLAVCSKTERVDTLGLRTKAEAELAEKRGAALSQALLKELRAKAVVESR